VNLLSRIALASLVFLIVAGRVGGVPAGEEASAFQNDPVEYYGVRFLTALLVFAITLLLYSLLRYRGRADGVIHWTLLALGVALLPAISIAFGTLLVFERAERVEFCGSCHLAMQPYVDDLRNPASESLAAIHYRNRYIPVNQCYACHTSFGLFGTFHAKIDGMLDVRKYYTGTFRMPIRMREPYRNTDCLKCHSGAVKWSGSHADCRREVLSGKTSCLECHGDTHPAHLLRNRSVPSGSTAPGARPSRAESGGG